MLASETISFGAPPRRGASLEPVAAGSSAHGSPASRDGERWPPATGLKVVRGTPSESDAERPAGASKASPRAGGADAACCDRSGATPRGSPEGAACIRRSACRAAASSAAWLVGTPSNVLCRGTKKSPGDGWPGGGPAGLSARRAGHGPIPREVLPKSAPVSSTALRAARGAQGSRGATGWAGRGSGGGGLGPTPSAVLRRSTPATSTALGAAPPVAAPSCPGAIGAGHGGGGVNGSGRALCPLELLPMPSMVFLATNGSNRCSACAVACEL